MTRSRLVRLLFLEWLLATGLLVLILGLQTVLGKYGAEATGVWSWISANVVPSLSLLATAALATPSKKWGSTLADKFKARIALFGGGVYLSVILGLVLVEPFLEVALIDALDRLALPFTIAQGVVVAAISVAVFEGR